MFAQLKMSVSFKIPEEVVECNEFRAKHEHGEWTEHVCSDRISFSYSFYLDMASVKAIEMPSVSRWKSCNESLPDPTDRVLFSKNGEVLTMDGSTAIYMAHKWKGDDMAWMPLPEAYKGGEEDKKSDTYGCTDS